MEACGWQEGDVSSVRVRAKCSIGAEPLLLFAAIHAPFSDRFFNGSCRDPKTTATLEMLLLLAGHGTPLSGAVLDRKTFSPWSPRRLASLHGLGPKTMVICSVSGIVLIWDYRLRNSVRFAFFAGCSVVPLTDAFSLISEQCGHL